MGDIVKVSLDAGTQGPFSLQKAVFKTLEMKKDPTAEAISAQGSCTSLSSLFSGGSPAANIRMNPAPTEAQKVANHFIINVPMTGRYTSAYGVRRLAIYNNEPRAHWGIDIAAINGTPILAPADGWRWSAGFSESDNGGSGYWVRTFHSYHTDPEHTDKSTNNKAIVFTYMHMKEATNLSSGQAVARGTEIGKCGGTGLTPNGYGKHLHFEAYVFDIPAGSLNSSGQAAAGKAAAGTPLWNAYLAAKRARQDPIQVCRWDAHFSAGVGTARVTTSQASPPLNQD
jgi:murein DD-endopeptidase MepM/ murein hydrolase activator NlpD